MFQLFEDNTSIAPRTYTIKGYKKKKGFSIKKLLLYFIYTIVAFVIVGFTVLSAYNAI